MRILDLDLDFFLEGVVHWGREGGGRPDGARYQPWAIDDALAFLEQQCGLTHPLPGFAVERHGELFGRWREAIRRGTLNTPLSVTHVDAHADLGLGESGYVYLLTELLHEPLERRLFPKRSPTDGDWLTFALACRWISDLTYVFNEGDRPADLMLAVMEGFDTNAANIELVALDEATLDRAVSAGGPDRPQPIASSGEPKVPFKWLPARHYAASEPFDAVCLARSPAFTPPEADPLYEVIRAQFVDETVL